MTFVVDWFCDNALELGRYAIWTASTLWLIYSNVKFERAKGAKDRAELAMRRSENDLLRLKAEFYERETHFSKVLLAFRDAAIERCTCSHNRHTVAAFRKGLRPLRPDGHDSGQQKSAEAVGPRGRLPEDSPDASGQYNREGRQGL